MLSKDNVLYYFFPNFLIEAIHKFRARHGQFTSQYSRIQAYIQDSVFDGKMSRMIGKDAANNLFPGIDNPGFQKFSF